MGRMTKYRASSDLKFVISLIILGCTAKGAGDADSAIIANKIAGLGETVVNLIRQHILEKFWLTQMNMLACWNSDIASHPAVTAWVGLR